MNFILIILIIIFIWIVFTFLIPILTFPRMPLIDFSLPVKLPKELNDEIKKLKRIKDDKKFIIGALEYIKKNFDSKSLFLYTKLHRHYYKEISDIIEKKGFFPCHIQAFILRLILIKSGRFREKDIQVHYTVYGGIIHEYLKVFVKGRWIDVDAWGYGKGVPFGHYSTGLWNWFRFRKK